MDKNLQELKKVFGENRVRVNESMSLHTTFKIGGPAEYYIEVDLIEDLVKSISTARKLNIPFFILGGGSNILVSDRGLKGLVIKNNCRKFEIMKMKGRMKNNSTNWELDVDNALVYAQSGVIMNQLVRFTIEQGFGGLEYHLGLPGTVGGAVFMNSNFPKKNVFVGDCVNKAGVLEKEDVVKEVDNSYFRFDYDKSILQENNEILLWVIFKLQPGKKDDLWKKGMEAIEHRGISQPKGWCAGCVFRNISVLQALSIPTPNRTTSAGYLIDKAGLKGKRIGDAMISTDHGNFIMNTGKAKAEDVLGIINLIKDEVFRKFGVNLEMEVKMVGF